MNEVQVGITQAQATSARQLPEAASALPSIRAALLGRSAGKPASSALRLFESIACCCYRTRRRLPTTTCARRCSYYFRLFVMHATSWLREPRTSAGTTKLASRSGPFHNTCIHHDGPGTAQTCCYPMLLPHETIQRWALQVRHCAAGTTAAQWALETRICTRMA